jgi:putative FmdB family regulatory protein
LEKRQAGRDRIAQIGEFPIMPAWKMPTYEYECEKCRKTFEVFQSMKDAAFTTCPESHCRMRKWGQGKVRRLLGTGAGLIFKGSGFYITDYRSEGYKQAAKKETSAGEGAKPAEKKAPEASKPAKSSKE